jgi:ABC-type polysaccharide/polyol phosphate transport system ATPase subunit
MNNAIEVKNLTKTFKIYQSPYDRMRDLLGFKNVNSKEFNAISNINFKVEKGEFYGILGKNGSGKSTLLKIVSGHTTETSGVIQKNGKISLLQLGLGFDPELTGMENIIKTRELQNLSTKNREIISKIVEFSEIGEFINYPVKNYSSGMYSRLAFSSAIMSEFDILMADEVLAVGDLSFSQKCLKKMRELKDDGKTLILVTHDIDAVKSFCDKAMWLNNGSIMSEGDAKNVAEEFRNYMLYGVIPNAGEKLQQDSTESESSKDDKRITWLSPKKEKLTISKSEIEICKFRIKDKESSIKTKIYTGEAVIFQMLYRCKEDAVKLTSIGLTLHNDKGQIAIHLNSSFFGGEVSNSESLSVAEFEFEMPKLSSGNYSLSFGVNGIKDTEDELLIKYDFAFDLQIKNKNTESLRRQGGYVVIEDCKFKNYLYD